MCACVCACVCVCVGVVVGGEGDLHMQKKWSGDMIGERRVNPARVALMHGLGYVLHSSIPEFHVATADKTQGGSSLYLQCG